MRWTAARSPRSRESILSARRQAMALGLWRSATSILTTSWSGRTIFISRTRNCAKARLGRNLHIGALPAHVEGMSRIHRKGSVVWEKPFLTGETNMSHTIGNLEYHHFKYDAFRRRRCSCSLFRHRHTVDRRWLQDRNGRRVEIDVPVFGKPLRNRLKIAADRYKPAGLKAL